MMIHAKYGSSSHNGLGQEDFFFFFFRLPWQPEFFTELKSLKFSESASPEDHFCEVSLKSVGRFKRKRFFKYLFKDGQTDKRTAKHTDGRWTLINHNSSGELKKSVC